tara:strand:- start:453 stop:650 length:198 start_codon:yes stop_codon:yes gene_type:complete
LAADPGLAPYLQIFAYLQIKKEKIIYKLKFLSTNSYLQILALSTNRSLKNYLQIVAWKNLVAGEN